MNKTVGRVVAAGLLLALGAFAWHKFFPSPQQAIRHRMFELARLASFSTPESPLAQAYNSQKLAGFCTTDVQIAVDVPGMARQTLTGRDQVQEAALAARTRLGSLNIEFVDVTVELAGDEKAAMVNLTAKARIAGDKDWVPQELKFIMQKIGHEWYISRVETVRTLL